jgi:hypothetical protein
MAGAKDGASTLGEAADDTGDTTDDMVFFYYSVPPEAMDGCFGGWVVTRSSLGKIWH